MSANELSWVAQRAPRQRIVGAALQVAGSPTEASRELELAERLSANDPELAELYAETSETQEA